MAVVIVGRGKRKKKLHGQRAQTLIAFALAFALFLMALFIVVVDLAANFVYYTRAQSAAEIGSQAGANDINPSSIFTSAQPQIDTRTYQGYCTKYAMQEALSNRAVTVAAACTLAKGGPPPGCSANPTPIPGYLLNYTVEACVTITFPLPIPLPPFASKATVHALFDAVAVPGTTVPQAP